MSFDKTGWVGRSEHVERLAKLLGQEQDDERRIKLISISGPGGSGKSNLFEYTYDDEESRRKFAKKKFLRLTINGTQGFPSLANLFTKELISSCQQRDKNNKPVKFKNLLKCKEALEQMNETAHQQIKDNKDKERSEITDQIIQLIIKGAIFGVELRTNKTIASAIQRYIDSHPDDINKAIAFISRNAAVFSKSKLLERPIANRVRNDLGGLLAESLIIDLNDAIGSISGGTDSSGERAGKNLLLVFDNFEKYVDISEKFIFERLVPELKRNSEFYTTMVFIGREKLTYASPYLTGEASKNFHGMFNEHSSEICIDQFTQQEAETYLRERSITDEKLIEKICRETNRFPYIMSAVANLSPGKGMSAQAANAFFIRTCYWLTEQQKGWIMALAFLDVINIDTIKIILPKDKPDIVLKWLKSEPSIKDPEAEAWQINHYIRESVRLVVENDQHTLADEYRRLSERAMKLMHERSEQGHLQQ